MILRKYLGNAPATFLSRASLRKDRRGPPLETKHMWCQRMCQSAIMSQKYISFSKEASLEEDGSGYTVALLYLSQLELTLFINHIEIALDKGEHPRVVF